MRSSINFFGDFILTIHLIVEAAFMLFIILKVFRFLFGDLIDWLREKHSKLFFSIVIVSCTLLGCLIYSWATARPVEEPRIAAQTSESKSSDKTGGGRDFPPPENSDGYIGNPSTKKFHEPSCSYLPDAANRIYFDTRDEALDAGYSACRRCYP